MEQKKIALEAENIHLHYSFKKSRALKDFFLFQNKKQKKYFEALKGVSFKLEEGTNLGLIGANGAGKSTLLRILAHTLIPDDGVITNNTSSVSLLSLGVGFKPDLSGKENIYLNGLLLGLSIKELNKLMDEIIEFAELGEFIHNPVKTYSSGMKSKLAFSIAINVNPDLLLIDELFSVGDARFKKKSKAKLESMIKDHRTVVMVSHNMKMIEQYCDHVLWLDKGKVIKYGKADEIIPEYLEFMEQS